MKKYSKHDQKLLATWTADCAEHVLPLFENEFPKDDRPRKAIETLRTWLRTSEFNMSEIREASLASHAAAREAKEKNAPASFAARAAGQAVATAHVPQHAYGSTYYALKAVAASEPTNAESKIVKERKWITEHLPEKLREESLSRIIIQKRGDRFLIKLQKDKDF